MAGQKRYYTDEELGIGEGAQEPRYYSDEELGIEPPKRTWGEAIKDTGAALMGGAAGLVKTGGDLYGLASRQGDPGAAQRLLELGVAVTEQAAGSLGQQGQ